MALLEDAEAAMLTAVVRRFGEEFLDEAGYLSERLAAANLSHVAALFLPGFYLREQGFLRCHF